MQKPITIQKDYTLSSFNYQFKLLLEMEVLIPNDDPVRLPNVFVEDMELKDLYQTYGKIKKDQASPRQLFKIIIYVAMNRSIQAEGSFANVKEDMRFRRYAYRGIENVTAQSVILAIAHNVNNITIRSRQARPAGICLN